MVAGGTPASLWRIERSTREKGLMSANGHLMEVFVFTLDVE
jgi:hypothetical protein